MAIEMNQKVSPPLVMFEQRAEEDREATLKAGRLVMKDVDYVVVRTPGSKDTLEVGAEGWISQCELLASRSPPKYPREWAEGHRENYRRWKAGQEAVPEGFSIRNWAGASKAQIENCARANVLTVEALAAANEQTLIMIGMGSRALKDKAQAWLDSAKGNVGEELAALRVQVASLTQTTTDLREKNKELESELASIQPRKQRA